MKLHLQNNYYIYSSKITFFGILLVGWFKNACSLRAGVFCLLLTLVKPIFKKSAFNFTMLSKRNYSALLRNRQEDKGGTFCRYFGHLTNLYI